jgi:hypothetical protein
MTGVTNHNLEIQAGGELVFEPDGWDNDKYEDGEDSPITGAADGFDPTETKPCIVPPIRLDYSKNIEFKGIKIANDIDGLDTAGIAGQAMAFADFHYCTIEGFQAGVYTAGRSMLAFFNCYFLENNIAISAGDGSVIALLGINHIRDSLKFAIVAFNGANITLRWWEDNPNTHYLTKIYNTESRNTYTAIHAMGNSTIYIGRPMITDTFQAPMNVEILNEVNFYAQNYFGIRLDSGSAVCGTQYISFAGKDHNGNLLNEGKDTIPAGQQIVQEGAGTVVSKL